MWAVHMQYECADATVVVGVLFMWVVERLNLIEQGIAYGSLSIMSRGKSLWFIIYNE